MKKVIYLFVGISALLFVASCGTSDDPVVVDPAAELIEISFAVNDFTPNVAAKGAFKDGVPECDDTVVPVTATVTLNSIAYDLNLISINGSSETEVLKLAADSYTVSAFVLKDANGNATHAAAHDISDYGQAWGPSGDDTIITLPINIDVEGFTKKKFELDVLCYQPYDYERFGFAWFEYTKYEIKTICFFGNICTDLWEDWRDAEGSPYANTITGYDFRAGFKVELFRADGVTPISTANSNIYPPQGFPELDDQGNNTGRFAPLCIEYPHMVGSEEELKFKIYLLQPDGTYKVDPIDIGTFKSGDMSDPALGDASFGGSKGVYVFEVGDCSDDDTKCETAYAFGGDVNSDGYSNDDNCFINLGFGNWGWTVGSLQAQAATYTFPIWAAAGQCDLSKGTEVGELTVEYNGSTATVTYTMNSGYTMSETQLYVGNDVLPSDNGNPTVAPGQYGNIHDDLDEASTDTYTIDGLSGDIYVVAHATVCGDFPE